MQEIFFESVHPAAAERFSNNFGQFDSGTDSHKINVLGMSAENDVAHEPADDITFASEAVGCFAHAPEYGIGETFGKIRVHVVIMTVMVIRRAAVFARQHW